MEKRIKELEAENLMLRLNAANRSIPWIAAMAAEISSHSDNTALTIKQAVAEAIAIYAEPERQLKP